MRVKVHWAETFLNWFPVHTKLYIRGERGKDWPQAEALRQELFHVLVPFFDRLRKEAYEEGFEAGRNSE